MFMTDIYLDLSIVLGLSLIVSLIIRWLRQPLIIGYIITGVIAGQAWLAWLDNDGLESFSQIGVTLLLFIVGLSLNPRTLKEVGKIAFLTGLGQIVFTTIFGYLVTRLVGFEPVAAIYLAVAMTFSSTVIVTRLLQERRDTETLYGRIAIGFLLVQDFVAMIILSLVAAVNSASGQSWLTIGMELTAKIIVITIAVILVMRFLVPRVDSKLAHSKEVLFLASLAIAFAMATLFDQLGLSLELGALLAGIMLSVSPYQVEISSRVRPLRDFFIIIFFIVMGSRLDLSMIGNYWFQAVILSLFILIGNPLVVLIIMGIKGYRKRTSFLVGLTMAQVSEFSLIFLSMGVYVGHLQAEIFGFMTLIALITIAMSTYFILHADRLYKILEKSLSIFELKKYFKEEEGGNEKHAEVILFGCDRLGGGILENLKKADKSFIVVDYNPELVARLRGDGIEIRFGDASSAVFLDNINFTKTKVVISTVPNFEVNRFLARYFKNIKANPAVILVASYSHEARKLYDMGATYVVMPPYLGRRYMTELVYKYGTVKRNYIRERQRHLGDLEYV